MTWAAVGIAGVSLVAGMSAAEDAEDAQYASRQAQNQQAQIQSRMVDIAEEEWSLYKTDAMPMLKYLADNRTTADRTAEEVASTADETKAAYVSQRRALARRAGLEEGADNERTAALLRPSYMDEAATLSSNIADARRKERARVEDTNWSRTLQAVGAYQRLPQDASANLQGAAASASKTAALNANLANSYNQEASQAAYGGAYLALNARRWMGRPEPSGGGSAPTGGVADPYAGLDLGQQDFSAGYYRDGGVIRGRRRGYSRHYADGGPVDGPGTGTSDSVPSRVRPNSYILSADTVDSVGMHKIQKLMEQAGVRPGMGGDDRGGLPVKLSNGEYQIPPEAVQFHGLEFWNKLQQKYHRPVMDDETGMANGGVIRKRALPRGVEDAIFRSMPARALSGTRR